MSSPQQIAAIRAAVLAAFDGVKQPPEADIAPHDCEECAELRAAFAHTDWRTMSTLVEEYPTGLSLLSSEAYAYFLGAYLLYALDHFTPDALPAEMLVYNLAPEGSPSDEHEEWHREKLRHMTREQMAVVERFLDLVEADAEFGEYVGDLSVGRARYRDHWEQRWVS